MTDEERENAEFRGRLMSHMETTASGITEIKEDARRQTKATDALRQEVTLGFGAVSDRITRVESAQQAHEDNHTAVYAQAEAAPSNGRKVAAIGGGGMGIGALIAEIVRALKGA